LYSLQWDVQEAVPDLVVVMDTKDIPLIIQSVNKDLLYSMLDPQMLIVKRKGLCPQIKLFGLCHGVGVYLVVLGLEARGVFVFIQSIDGLTPRENVK
jgi:hypothetical protein